MESKTPLQDRINHQIDVYEQIHFNPEVIICSRTMYDKLIEEIGFASPNKTDSLRLIKIANHTLRVIVDNDYKGMSVLARF